MWIAIAVLCTLIEAIFTALEVATNASSRTRLRSLAAEDEAAQLTTAHADETPIEYSKSHRKISRATQVLELLETPQRLSWMFLCVTSLTMWTAATAIVWQAAFAHWNWSAQVAALSSVLFVAEVLPLLIAARHPETVAMRGARWIRLAIRVLNPLIVLLKGAGNLEARTLGAGSTNASGVTPHELRTALATAEEAGVIESDERALLEGAMDFRERHVREVMTPRSEVVFVRDDDSLLVALQTAMGESHSRLPAVDANQIVVGIVATKDLLPFSDELFSSINDSSSKHQVRDIMRAPLWVEENAPVASVLEELRRQRSLMAIVRNTLGETVGIVTLEDLLEEIVGEIQDEYDDEAPLIMRENADLENVDLENEKLVNENAIPETTQSETARDISSTRYESHSVLCDADAKVREVQRFWREEFGENVRLQMNGDDAPSSLSMREFASHLLVAQLFAATDSVEPTEPICGARANAGFVTASSVTENDEDEERGEPEVCVLQLEIVEMSGEEIEKVRLFRSAPLGASE